MLSVHWTTGRSSCACRVRGALLGSSLLAFAASVSAQGPADESAAMSAPPSAISDALPNGTINDDDPESSVLSPEEAMKNPLNMGYLMMALSDRADKAAARGDHSKEAKYYRALAKAAPDRAIGYRRACAAHDLAHESDKAVEMCRAALGTGGLTVDDHLKFLSVLLKRPGTPSETDLADADAVVERLETELKLGQNEAGRKVIAEAKCQIAAKLEDPDRLEVCVEQLRVVKAEPAKLFTYEWAFAVANGDATGAQQVIEAARKSGVPAPALELMQRGLSKANEVPRARALRTAARRWWPVATLLLGLALIVLSLRRSRPRMA